MKKLKLEQLSDELFTSLEKEELKKIRGGADTFNKIWTFGTGGDPDHWDGGYSNDNPGGGYHYA